LQKKREVPTNKASRQQGNETTSGGGERRYFKAVNDGNT